MKKIFLMTLAALVMASCGDVTDNYFARVDDVTLSEPDPEAPDPEYPIPEPVDPGNTGGGDPASYWYQAADSATMGLLNRYWPPLLTRATPQNDVVSYWAFTERADTRTLSSSNYWPQAHAMDAIIDAYNRTPSDAEGLNVLGREILDQKELWLSIYDKWFQGAPRMQWCYSTNWGSTAYQTTYPHFTDFGNAGGWRNYFIDDMAWMVLTHIRMYESLVVAEPALAAKYLATGKDMYDRYIWNWAWDTWRNPLVGGLFWCLGTGGDAYTSKNACINGPGMVIAGKLAWYSEGAEREKYLDQAKKIYNFFLTTTLATSAGQVRDNVNSAGTSISGGALTYNQGTFMGGCHWLYKLTGEAEYLNRAITATDYSLANLQTGSGNTRVLVSHDSEGGGNNCVFAAIFLRYFIPLINEPEVSPTKRQEWYGHLERWANCVWKEGRAINKNGSSAANAMLFGTSWNSITTVAATSIHLGNMVSGSVLVESMNLVKLPIQ